MLNMLFVGDVAVQGDGQLALSPEIVEKFKEYDIRVCNFEGAAGDIEKSSPAPKAGPLLLQSDESYTVVKQLGFDVFGLANNHILDFGEKALNTTVRNLESMGGSVIGASCGEKNAYEPYVFNADGVTVALFSAAENSFGTADAQKRCGHAHLFSRELLLQIRKYKKVCDKIVLLAHGGLENLHIPMPEWMDAYRNFIDFGVDVVIGHHPHVVQGWERYGDGLIFYSLGNFLWQRRKQSFVDLKTMMVGLRIEGAEIAYEVIPVKVENNRLLLNENDEEYEKELNGYCDVLKEENKDQLVETVDRFCLDLYRGAFKQYIFNTCGLTVVKGVKDYIKTIVKTAFFKQTVNDNFVYHNHAVETNNWVISRAVRRLREKRD